MTQQIIKIAKKVISTEINGLEILSKKLIRFFILNMSLNDIKEE